jgi:hypothetical protein
MAIFITGIKPEWTCKNLMNLSKKEYEYGMEWTTH